MAVTVGSTLHCFEVFARSLERTVSVEHQRQRSLPTVSDLGPGRSTGNRRRALYQVLEFRIAPQPVKIRIFDEQRRIDSRFKGAAQPLDRIVVFAHQSCQAAEIPVPPARAQTDRT